MREDLAAPPLAVHTSGGVVPHLEEFATELRNHLPWDPDNTDWFFNLQVHALLGLCMLTRKHRDAVYMRAQANIATRA